VSLRCTGCGASYKVQEFAAQLDDLLEEEMGFVPLDRL
jgi:hypothetical protein